jgi:hypothetical protein
MMMATIKRRPSGQDKRRIERTSMVIYVADDRATKNKFCRFGMSIHPYPTSDSVTD